MFLVTEDSMAIHLLALRGLSLSSTGMYHLDCFICVCVLFFFFSSRRRHTRFDCDWSSDVCSSDLELMQQAGTERPGTMAAVLGLATAEVEAACRAASSGGAVVVAANLNAPDQTVISGDPEAVAKAGAACRARGAKRAVPLKVSGAFHSSLMAPAANHLRLALERAPFQDPAFPVIANATAEPVRNATRARRLLADQLTAPVRWVACMQRAAELAGAGARFIEVGPGNVLAGLLRRIVPDASVTSLGTADDVATFLEAA